MTAESGAEFGPWNPGLQSTIPRDLLKLSTMFRPENVFGSLAEVEEITEATGIAPVELSAFRPERLVAHEVVIRVTADLHIPDGPRYEDLGINLRRMIRTVLDDYVAPEMPRLVERFETLRAETAERIAEELEAALGARPATPPEEGKASLLGRLFGRKTPAPAARAPSAEERTLAALQDWSSRAETESDAHLAACLSALAKIVGAIVRTRGRLIADHAKIVSLATTQVCNGHGSDVLGHLVQPIFERAAAAEGYHVLPPQAEPFIMNVKGASASGKSTMRSLQRELAGRLGVPWDDFALISPDYWRKFLLDYSSLGEHYKYAASLTGHELAIIDRKLDRHMARKARDGRMTHLLIDRFRFDSFSPHDGSHADSRLLTRFGSTVYLFFLVTPPEATVERAWTRGLDTGRFKAVDDLLHHNIEAFMGMPQLFFSWALSHGKEIHYEFLDNSVEKGERPKTIASGRNGTLNVYDVTGMLDIERFRRINIEATAPEEVYEEGADTASENAGFLRQCLGQLKRVEFVDPSTRRTYGVVEEGRWTVWDRSAAPGGTVDILLSLGAGAAPENALSASSEAGSDLDNALRSMVGRLV